MGKRFWVDLERNEPGFDLDIGFYLGVPNAIRQRWHGQMKWDFILEWQRIGLNGWLVRTYFYYGWIWHRWQRSRLLACLNLLLSWKISHFNVDTEIHLGSICFHLNIHDLNIYECIIK